MMRTAILYGAALLAAMLPALAWAGCSRPIVAPVAPIGASVTVHGDTIGGLYPEMLRAGGKRGGCEFRFSAVPRARLEAMFESGRADLLMPATRTPRRDRYGYFVPLAGVRAAVISIDGRRAPVHTVGELLERKDLRVALVRGFDFGDAYQAMVTKLAAQGRVMFEADAVGVARLLQAGYADVTVMTPNVLEGALKNDARVTPLLGKLRIEPLVELPWGESGIYISRRSVNAADRAALEKLLARAIRSGEVRDSYQRHYPEQLRNGSIRPHPN